MTVFAPREKIQLFNSVSVAGDSGPFQIFGGDYAYSITGTINGASVQLYYLGDDGVNYQALGSARTTVDSSNNPVGAIGVGIGSGAILKAVITGGPPTALFVSLSRLP